MRTPSISVISKRLKTDDGTARQIRLLFDVAKTDENLVDVILERCDKMLGGHGVEPLRGGDWRNYWGDSEVLYVNMGDTYDPTVYYDTRTEKFGVGSYGNLVEAQPERFAL